MGTRRAGLLVAAGLLVSGCFWSDSTGVVARQWSQDMRELQINAVFPPREDFQIGDLYLPPAPPDKAEDIADEKGYVPLASWVGSIDLSRELLAFYSTRRAYPPTPANQTQETPQPTLACSAANLPALNAAAGAAAAAGVLNKAAGGEKSAGTQTKDGVVQGAVDSLCNIFTSPQARSVDRMRLVAFPDFAKTTVTEGDLSGLIPVEALTIAFGARSRSARSVTLSVPVAESVGLPLNRIASKLAGGVKEVCKVSLSALPEKQQDSFKKTQIFHLTAVTEVYYTRSIDVAVVFEDQGGVGLDLGLADPTGTADPPGEPGPVTQQDLPAPSASDPPSTDPPSTDPPSTDPPSADPPSADPPAQSDPPADPPTGATTLAEALKRIDALNQALASALQRGGPGGALKVLSLSAGSIGMRRSFPQPVAIGYRGVTLAVKVTPDGSDVSCAIVGGGVAEDVTPLIDEAAATE